MAGEDDFTAVIAERNVRTDSTVIGVSIIQIDRLSSIECRYDLCIGGHAILQLGNVVGYGGDCRLVRQVVVRTRSSHSCELRRLHGSRTGFSTAANRAQVRDGVLFARNSTSNGYTALCVSRGRIIDLVDSRNGRLVAQVVVRTRSCHCSKRGLVLDIANLTAVVFSPVGLDLRECAGLVFDPADVTAGIENAENLASVASSRFRQLASKLVCVLDVYGANPVRTTFVATFGVYRPNSSDSITHIGPLSIKIRPRLRSGRCQKRIP